MRWNGGGSAFVDAFCLTDLHARRNRVSSRYSGSCCVENVPTYTDNSRIIPYLFPIYSNTQISDNYIISLFYIIF